MTNVYIAATYCLTADRVVIYMSFYVSLTHSATTDCVFLAVAPP